MKKKSIFIGMLVVVMAAFAATAFVSQKQQLVNRDPAASAADLMSTMSCILKNFNADQEATASNPNPNGYLAFIDKNLCQGGTASGSDAVPSYTRYWVEPKLVNDTLSIEAWELDDDHPGYIKATVVAGNKISPPYGEWSVDWCTERATDDPNYLSDPCAKKGHVLIDSNQNYKVFYRRELSGTWSAAYDKVSNGSIASDKTTGFGRYFERNNDDNGLVNNGHFAFDRGALKDYANGSIVCKNPSASDAGLRRTLWEAWLYNASTQAAITEDTSETAGFPVQKVGTSSVGWAGYEGVRLKGSKAAEQSGDFKRLNGDGATYTAFGSYGKLVKHTNTRLSGGLAALDRVVLQANLYRNAFPTTLFYLNPYTPTASPWNDKAKVLYYWNNDTQKFVFFARDTSPNGSDGKVFENFSRPHEFTIAELLTAMRSSAADGNPTPTPPTLPNLRSYSREIWGFQKGSDTDHHILLADSEWPRTTRSISNVVVTRLSQTQVVPGSSDAPTEDLVCIGKCPRDDGINVKLQLEKSYDYPMGDYRASDYYVFNANGDLKTKVNEKIIKYEKIGNVDTYVERNAIDSTRSDFWFDSFIPASKLAQLTCRVDPDSGSPTTYCSSDTVSPENVASSQGETYGVRGLDYYYVWNSGTLRHTKFNGIKKADGTPLEMKSPLALTYDVPNDPAYGLYAGKKTSLKYLGNGQLWTPGHCENIVSGVTPSLACDQTNEVYVHDFIIPYSESDTAQSRVKDSEGAEYLVKWARQGIYYPRHSDQTLCDTSQINANFTTAYNLTLPTSTEWNNPRTDMASRRPTVGVDVLPRYIQKN